MSKSPKKTAVSEADDALIEQVRATCRKAADQLDWCIEHVSAQLREQVENQGKYNDKLASHLSYLNGAVVSSLGELRKLDAGLRAQAKKLTPEQEHEAMLAYVRELPIERRLEIRHVLDELEGETSVLGHDTGTVSDFA